MRNGAGMIPAGYMLKKTVTRPDWLPGVDDICSVSDCVSVSFLDFTKYWKINGYCFYNSAADIVALCSAEEINMSGYTLFYYEVFEQQFDDERREWSPFEPTVPSLPTLSGRRRFAF